MEVYKFDKDFKDRIAPMPGDLVRVCGAELKAVEDRPGSIHHPWCIDCDLDNPSIAAGIGQDMADKLCMRTLCGFNMRDDERNIHYEYMGVIG